MIKNARFSLWITALALSPLMFAACGDDDGGGGGGDGSAGEAGDAGEGGTAGTTGGSTGTGGGGRGGSSGSGMGGTSGAAGAEGGMGGEPGGAGGDAGDGGTGAVDAGGRVIDITPTRFFPEGVTVDKLGNFYIGSMYLGAIYRATADDSQAEPFILGGSNDLVSVLGLYADDATNTLWVCSSDAGNAALSGSAPVALKAFDLTTGAPTGSWEWPAPEEPHADAPDGIHGFCNDITVDAEGNVYATDSWYPRILRLPAEGRSSKTPLEEWVTDPTFGEDMWHLNGIDVDQATRTLYVVENHPGHLWKIPINSDGTPGAVTEIETSQPLGGPDGLKVLAPNLLVTAESNGVSLIRIDGDEGEISEVFHGFDGVATLALHQASAWIVENQGDHFWNPGNAGPNADPPFRLVEVPLDVGAGGHNIDITPPNFFPEGVAVDDDGNFYVGSMQLGAIHRATASSEASSEFIAPGTQDLVSVLGMFAHSDSNRLWVCSSDTDATGAPHGSTTLQAFELDDGTPAGSWAWPAPSGTPLDGTTANGFCNDITVDTSGNVYATDSWYPRILRLPAGADSTTALEVWEENAVLGVNQWSLNGIDYEPAGNDIYVVNIETGQLFRIDIDTGGTSGTVTEIQTSKPLRRPDGLKVIDATTLAVAESQPSGMAILELSGNTAKVITVNTGLDSIATFALLDGSAWVVEAQADHFWGSPASSVEPPFRLVEVPLAR